MNFIKLGKYTINPAAIAYISWDVARYSGEDTKVVRVFLLVRNGDIPEYLDFKAESKEALALKQYFETEVSCGS